VNTDPFVANRVPALRRFLSAAPVVTRPIPQMQALTRRLLAERQFEVVVVSGAVMEKYARQAPAGTSLALEEHNSLSRMMYERYRAGRGWPARGQYWFSWQKMRRYERALYGRFDLVTLVSEQDREYSKRIVHDQNARVRVIPNGVDCAANPFQGARRAATELIYNGALTYQANYDAVRFFLAEIYPLIRATKPETTFKVTGSTDGVPLGGLALDESVTLTGYVEDIRPEVAGAAVCVIPLKEGGGTRLKILEALALGTPVVSTSKGAEGLAVRAGEHLLIADDPGCFARETTRLLEDEALRRRLAENGRRLVEARYDWRQIGRDYTALIERLAIGRKGF
jgi:glycosyltransferase involved in cell wall biosynthesis